jgi:hypothetical protein
VDEAKEIHNEAEEKIQEIKTEQQLLQGLIDEIEGDESLSDALKEEKLAALKTQQSLFDGKITAFRKHQQGTKQVARTVINAFQWVEDRPETRTQAVAPSEIYSKWSKKLGESLFALQAVEQKTRAMCDEVKQAFTQTKDETDLLIKESQALREETKASLSENKTEASSKDEPNSEPKLDEVVAAEKSPPSAPSSEQSKLEVQASVSELDVTEEGQEASLYGGELKKEEGGIKTAICESLPSIPEGDENAEEASEAPDPKPSL